MQKEKNVFSNHLTIAKRARQKGEIPRILLIGGGIFLVVIVIIIILVAVNGGSNANKKQNATEDVTRELHEPVYEKQLGDIYFTLNSSTDLGNVLKAQNSYQQDITTTERFIQVVVGAQNKGKVATGQYNWDLGNIIDSDGRVFTNINNEVSFYLPNPNPCGLSLKPGFYPVSCTKIYEVAKISKGLKIEVTVRDQSTALLDLNLNHN